LASQGSRTVPTQKPNVSIKSKNLSEGTTCSTARNNKKLQQWYDTTQEIIKYMKEEARSREESSMRDIRTYFSKIIEPDNSLQNQQEPTSQQEQEVHKHQISETHNTDQSN
jgi:hypothetical protein